MGKQVKNEFCCEWCVMVVKKSKKKGSADTGAVQRDRLEFQSGQQLMRDVNMSMSKDAQEDKNDKTVRRAYRKEKKAAQMRNVMKSSDGDEVENAIDSYGAPYETMVELPSEFSVVRDTMLYKTLCYYIYWGTLEIEHIYPLTNLAAVAADHPELFNPLEVEDLMTSAMVAACDVDQQLASFLVDNLPAMLDREARVPCPVEGHTKQSLVKLAVFTLFGLALVRGDVYSHERWGPTILQVASATELRKSGVPDNIISMLESARGRYANDMDISLRRDPV